MATNNRVSSFDEINFLHGTEAAFVPAPETEGNDDDVLFVVSRSGVKSEKITFKNNLEFKKSIQLIKKYSSIVWVNLARREQSIIRHIKSKIKIKKKITIKFGQG